MTDLSAPSVGRPGPAAAPPPRPLLLAIARGARRRCPACGRGALFKGFLTAADRCSACGTPLSGHRADDLPAYLAVILSGKLSMAALVALESTLPLSVGALTAAVLAVALGSALGLLSPLKGAVIGVQWANEMHGFDPHGGPDPGAPDPDPLTSR